MVEYPADRPLVLIEFPYTVVGGFDEFTLAGLCIIYEQRLEDLFTGNAFRGEPQDAVDGRHRAAHFSSGCKSVVPHR